MRQEICHFWEGEVLMEIVYEVQPSNSKKGEEIWRKVYGSQKPCQCPEKPKIPKGGSR